MSKQVDKLTGKFAKNFRFSIHSDFNIISIAYLLVNLSTCYPVN